MKRLILLIMTMLMLIFSAPLWAAGVLEEFESGSGGFSEGNRFSVSGGRLTFTGDGSDIISFDGWNGGLNPGGWSPAPSNSNYFDDFAVYVDVTWLGGSEDYSYGLSVCNQKNASGTADNVSFFIDGVGSNTAYHIDTVKNGESQTVVDWTLSDAIIPNSTNELSIFKSGNYLVFSINDTDVEELEIDGCFGGSVAVGSANLTNVAFDNFKLLPFFSEYFSSGMGEFLSKDLFSVYDGQLVFRGDGSDGLQSLAWNGGYHPGGFLPNPGDSNYFENFNVSVDTLWLGGSDTGTYGLSVCNHKKSSGSLDYVIFVITGDGSYTVSTIRNGIHERLVEWTDSHLINAKGSDYNELSITKKDNKFSFSINDTKVQELEIDGCVGGSIDLEASKIVNVAFDGFFLIDLPSTKSPTSTPTPTLINQPPVANFSVTPSSGKAPLTVTLDASVLSIDPDGTITHYQWSSSDGQTASGSVTTMTFRTVGTYTITLSVTDDKGASSNSFEKTVTVEPPDLTGVTPLPSHDNEPTPPISEGDLYLAFEGLQPFYNIGDKVIVDLVQKAHRNRFERVDLWVAVYLPNQTWLFFTGIPMSPYSLQPQAFKKSIDNLDESARLLPEFEVSPGMGGDYIFHAAFVTEGKNPVTNGMAIKEKIEKKTTLPN